MCQKLHCSSDTLLPVRGRKRNRSYCKRQKFTFRYLTPREGTKTCLISCSNSIATSVQIPYSPWGDENNTRIHHQHIHQKVQIPYSPWGDENHGVAVCGENLPCSDTLLPVRGRKHYCTIRLFWLSELFRYLSPREGTETHRRSL